VSKRYGVDADALLGEYRQSGFREWFGRRRAALERFPGPYRLGTTGEFGCEALYLLVRAARPQTIVETGVLYGASSAHRDGPFFAFCKHRRLAHATFHNLGITVPSERRRVARVAA
jgi:hypothetical protein